MTDDAIHKTWRENYTGSSHKEYEPMPSSVDTAVTSSRLLYRPSMKPTRWRRRRFLVHVRESELMNNEQSRLGVISFILALMPVLGFVAIFCAGHVAQENEVVGISLTMVMYATIVIAPVIGLICGAMSLLRKPTHRALPVAGTLLNAIWMVVLLFAYIAIQINR